MVEKSKRPPDLGLVLLALADPLARHIIELVAATPTSLKDMHDHLDVGERQIISTGKQLEQAGLITRTLVEDREVLFEYHALALDLVRIWLDRIAAIRN